MAQQRRARARTAAGSFRVETFRIGSGGSAFIRTLSDSYSGLLTHWVQRNTEYCDPSGCRHCGTKAKRSWKGYFSGLVWSLEEKMWLPWVIEITEHAELDLRDKFSRGQEWHFSREKDSNEGKRYPVTCRQSGTVELSALPPAFDPLPVLRTMYHCHSLTLGVENPAPPRVYVDPVQDSPPRGLAASQMSAEQLAEQRAGVIEQLRKSRLQDGQLPEPSANGKK